MNQFAVEHLGQRWSIVFEDRHWFARDATGSDTGPFSTAEQARDFVLAIVPA